VGGRRHGDQEPEENRLTTHCISERMLEETVVKDVEGQDFRLSQLWRDGPAVVVFVRHFG
jgi:hypothetical protein